MATATDDKNEGGCKRVETQVTVDLYNPSVVAVEDVGTLRLAMVYKDVNMGTITGENAPLKRGWNTLTLTGLILPHGGTEHELEVLAEMMTGYVGERLRSSRSFFVSFSTTETY